MFPVIRRRSVCHSWYGFLLLNILVEMDDWNYSPRSSVCFNYNIKGHCNYGDGCWHVHSRLDEPCRHFYRGKCKWGWICRYTHDESVENFSDLLHQNQEAAEFPQNWSDENKEEYQNWCRKNISVESVWHEEKVEECIWSPVTAYEEGEDTTENPKSDHEAEGAKRRKTAEEPDAEEKYNRNEDETNLVNLDEELKCDSVDTALSDVCEELEKYGRCGKEACTAKHPESLLCLDALCERYEAPSVLLRGKKDAEKKDDIIYAQMSDDAAMTIFYEVIDAQELMDITQCLEFMGNVTASGHSGDARERCLISHLARNGISIGQVEAVQSGPSSSTQPMQQRQEVTGYMLETGEMVKSDESQRFAQVERYYKYMKLAYTKYNSLFAEIYDTDKAGKMIHWIVPNDMSGQIIFRTRPSLR